jgi:hypothetical protein
MTALKMLLLVLVMACSRKPEEPPPGESKPAASVAPAPPAADNRPAAAPAGSAREIVWIDPPGWQKLPPSSSMRKATYKVPAAAKDSEDGELAIFYFGAGQGGSTEANIQRWISQFPDAKPSDAKRSQRTVGGMSQTIVEVEGTYSSGMPGGPPSAATPKGQYRLIGAVVETPAGPYFFKMTGPKKTVEAARGAFFTMLDSVKPS